MNTELLLAELIIDEGMRLKPYLDTMGKTTIGIGRNLTDVGISESEARMLCMADIAQAELTLDTHFPWWRRLDEIRQRVLMNMAFNMGPRVGKEKEHPGLLDFVRAMPLIEQGHYEQAAVHMLASRWAKQVGSRAKKLAELIRRGTPPHVA